MRASVAGLSPPARTWTLLDGAGRPDASPRPGTLGGHRRSRVVGRLALPSALRAIAEGGPVRHRAFFADAETAVAAGCRPCGVGPRDERRAWRAAR